MASHIDKIFDKKLCVFFAGVIQAQKSAAKNVKNR